MAAKGTLCGEVRNIPLSMLEAAEWNAQEMSPVEFDRLKTELTNTGLIDPIQVVPLDTGNFRILGGHQRAEAARELGWKEISCVVLSDARFRDEDLQRLLTIRLNILKGKLNPEKFAGLFRQLADKYGETTLHDLMGFTDRDAVVKLLKGVKDAATKAGLPGGIQKQLAKAARKAETAGDVGKILNHLLTEYGDTVEHNFMVFVHGKTNHLYIACNDTVWKGVRDLVERCREEKIDINKPLARLLASKEIGEGVEDEEEEGQED